MHRRRDLGGLLFLDLRDRDGIVQVSLGPDWTPAATLERAAGVSMEAVVLVEGEVVARPPEARNPDMATGEIEVHATEVTIVGPTSSDALPIPVWRAKGEDLPSEERRLRHRHLDLRRAEMQHNLALRHRLLQRTRATLTALEFYEIETPILTRPTPEGARDYLVPSSIHRGQFYALPQSPQIYKQVLMCAGFDRYFQIARCFRDEDLRHDRQPEFTQIDLEASFVGPDDVYDVLERLFVALWDEGGKAIDAPFHRLTYRDALETYGTDKPDLRFALALEDQRDRFKGFRAFDDALADGGRVRGLRVPGGAALSRKDVDQLTELAKQAGAGGLASLKRQGDALSGPLAKIGGVSADTAGLQDGDLLLVTAGTDPVTSTALDRVRRAVIRRLALRPSVPHAFAWVESFPLFEREADTGAWVFAHHPFTAPHPDDIARVKAGEREGVRALHYDLVYNGYELGSGSIRITEVELQLQVLQLLGIGRDDAWQRFGFLLRALAAGAPPHGGFAVGFDRVAMLLAGVDNLRDVIAFPKTTAARALFEDAPTRVEERDLRELALKVEDR